METLAERLQASLGDAFTLERELGGGGMSRVFVARERALDRQVVVKTLDLEASANGSAERFRREVRTIAKLQHPHVVPLLTAGGDDTLLWYAMPFVSGESLRARLVREGALPLADALRVMRELLDALGFAHDHGIVHRDVKPENILLEGKHAVVADFGVAKALADAGVTSGLTSAGVALGTPAYMAPEQAMADATANHRADLYAAGAVLYEMLVGAPPYSGNAQAVVAAHLTAPVPSVADRRRDVPPVVASLVHRLLAKNPAERPQTAHEALATLDAVTTPSSTTVDAGAPRTAPPNASSGRRRLVIGGATLAAVAAAAALATSWARRAGAAPVLEGADVIAVMPLASTGDSTLARLGRDLVVTLSANLDGVGDVRAVDATSVIMRAPRALPREEALRAGRALGARSILHGTLVREGGLVRATMLLVSVEGGDPLARISADAAVDSVRALTDALTNAVLGQIWRRGKAPSLFLSEVTTRSNDAVRAFLAGEAHFRRLAWDSAVADYGRAVAADNMFAQAYLRMDYARSWANMPPDTMVRARLVALMDRLPKRDRDMLGLRFARGLSDRQVIDSASVLATRYPDYAPAQYNAADRIIHYGPAVGVPLERAVPYLDRLDALAPNYADNTMHRVQVAATLGDTAMLMRAAKQLGDNSFGRRFADGLTARRAGSMPSAAQATAALRDLGDVMRSMPSTSELPSNFAYPFASAVVIDSSLAAVLRDGSLVGLETAATAARGALSVARGDFATGVATLAAIDPSRAPMYLRLGAVRSAAMGSWLGGMSVGAADTALARTRASLGTVTGIDAAELQWLDGVIGVADSDSVRVFRAAAAITDTGSVGRQFPISLRALWRERQTGNIDDLIVLEDSAIAAGRPFPSMAALHRLAIGRALTRAGEPARAEHYLQWTDAWYPLGHQASVQFMIGPYNSYQRALAFEAAGDRARAKLYFERFIEMVDLPPSSIRPQVDDAKARLARLTADVRR
jgi:serine/threonine-protein kinase